MDMRETATAATARLVVQMTPTEKRRLTAQAKRLGVSTSEFVRRRVAEDDLVESREEIEALLATLADAAQRIMASLDRSIAEAEAAIDEVRERRSA